MNKTLEAINVFKTQLSEEWNKPKDKNLRRNKDGDVFNDSREPRDYEKIKYYQEQINKEKAK